MLLWRWLDQRWSFRLDIGFMKQHDEGVWQERAILKGEVSLFLNSVNNARRALLYSGCCQRHYTLQNVPSVAVDGSQFWPFSESQMWLLLKKRSVSESVSFVCDIIEHKPKKHCDCMNRQFESRKSISDCVATVMLITPSANRDPLLMKLQDRLHLYLIINIFSNIRFRLNIQLFSHCSAKKQW